MRTMTATLTWPIVALLVTGGIHFSLEAARPDLRDLFVPATLAPLLLAYGAWTGASAIRNGGGLVEAVAGAAILGLLPLALDVVGFGMLLGRGTDAGLQAGLFGFAMVLFGGIIGTGYARSSAAPQH